MLTEGVSFPEAVERLAGEAGVPLPAYSPEAEAREERRKTLHDIVELAAKFFEATLASRNGARGRGYLADRGIAPATQLKFRLGYAPAEQYALKEHLGAAKMPVEDMVEAGLIVAGEDIAVPYDRFRDRIMFPIADWRGRVIAFGGRALEKDVAGQIPQLAGDAALPQGRDALQHRRRPQGRPRRRPGDRGRRLCRRHRHGHAGYEATVAPLGTALTADQLALMWRMTDEPILCFDGDDAGRRAAYRAAELALPLVTPGKSLKFAALPDGQDPDDLARSGGREAIADVLGAARPLAHVLWARESETGPFDTPERRAALEARLSAVTATIADESVRRYYRQDFGARLRQLFAPAEVSSVAAHQRGFDAQGRGGAGRRFPHGRGLGPGRFGDQRQNGPYVAASAQLAASPLHRGHRAAIPRREALILQAALNHPWLLHDHLEEFAAAEFRHTDTQKLKGALIDVFAHAAANFAQNSEQTGDGERAELAAELDPPWF